MSLESWLSCGNHATQRDMRTWVSLLTVMSASPDAEFEAARVFVERYKGLSPSNDQKLSFYGYFKQATAVRST